MVMTMMEEELNSRVQSSKGYPANDQPKLSLFILRDTSKFRTQSTTPTSTRLFIYSTSEEKSNIVRDSS